MCGCTSSTGTKTSYSLNQPEDASSTKDKNVASRKMPKRVPISKQLSSMKALAKGSELEKAIATAALVYNNSADSEGKLSKGEAKELLQTQFAQFIQGQETKPKYQEIISALNENKNDYIDFEDFMVQVLSITLISDRLPEIQKVQKTK